MKSDQEIALRQWLLARSPEPFAGLDERSRQVYRRLVRRSLKNGVRSSLPRTRALMADKLDELIETWIEESPPTTRLYWQLPLEFAGWVRERDDLPHQAAAELMHWEALLLDVRNSPGRDEALVPVEEPTKAHRISLDPSARLGIYHHPVYAVTRDEPAWPAVAPQPQFVVTYRRDEVPHWKVLEPQQAQFLARLAEGASLKEGMDFLSELYGELDQSNLVPKLLELQRRGALCLVEAAPPESR